MEVVEAAEVGSTERHQAEAEEAEEEGPRSSVCYPVQEEVCGDRPSY